MTTYPEHNQQQCVSGSDPRSWFDIIYTTALSLTSDRRLRESVSNLLEDRRKIETKASEVIGTLLDHLFPDWPCCDQSLHDLFQSLDRSDDRSHPHDCGEVEYCNTISWVLKTVITLPSRSKLQQNPLQIITHLHHNTSLHQSHSLSIPLRTQHASHHWYLKNLYDP